MYISAVNGQNFGMMFPTMYINTATDTVPAIIRKVDVAEVAGQTKRFLKNSTGFPVSKPDRFIRQEAIILDSRIKILNPDGTEFRPSTQKDKIFTMNLKGPGRKHYDKVKKYH